MKLLGVITKSEVFAKDDAQRLKVKVKKLKMTQFGYVRVLTPVWSHSKIRKDAEGFQLHRRCALLYLKVTH